MLLATVDGAIDLVNKSCAEDEKETVSPLRGARGYEDQSFAKLVTKVDAKTTNVSQIPMLGLGTWLSDKGKVATAVEYALRIGYRHIDAAAAYGNEKEVGQGIKAALDAGIKREDIFVTSKLWNTKHHPDDVVPALKQTLSDLGLEYVDLYLVHWPLTLKRGANPFPKREDGTLDYGEIIPHEDTWKGMEECVRLGLAKHIGLSNFNAAQIDNVLKHCKIRPTVLQCEGHPYLAHNALRKYCKEHQMVLAAYSPLGNPARPQAWDHALKRVLDEPVLHEMANALGVSVPDICIRYQIDRGVVVIPKSVTPTRILSNFQVWGFKLNEEQLKQINALDKHQRYGIPTILDADGNRIIRDGDHPFWPWNDTPYALKQ